MGNQTDQFGIVFACSKMADFEPPLMVDQRHSKAKSPTNQTHASRRFYMVLREKQVVAG